MDVLLGVGVFVGTFIFAALCFVQYEAWRHHRALGRYQRALRRPR